MATTVTLLPDLNRAAGTTVVSPEAAVPAGLLRVLLAVRSTTHTDPARSVALTLEASYDGGATWQHEASATFVGGTPTRTPGVYGLFVSVNQSPYPTHARGVCAVAGGAVRFSLTLTTEP